MSEWIVGWHAVKALVARSPERIEKIYAQQGAPQDKLDSLGRHAQVLDRDTFNKTVNWAEGVAHQGIAALAQPSQALPEGALLEVLSLHDSPLVLALDGVTDPRNLGAVLRSAEAAGVAAVIQPKDNSAALNQAARKTACGAAELVPLVQVTNLGRTLSKLQEQGYWVSGAAGEGAVSLHTADLTGPRVIVLGSEDKGIRKAVRDKCDQLVAIPMSGTVSSLNVSVAAGVFLFEAVRQRSQ